MLLNSHVTHEAKKIIQNKLIEVSKNNDVQILFAIESGSRAWGFPSTNSDYDVRFVFTRPKDTYLSIKQYRDVIETEITDEPFLKAPLDLNGWDIRKALQLSIKSNAVLLEWLQSPIQYYLEPGITHELFTFAKKIRNKDIIENHYYKIALNAWRQILDKPEVNNKLYCYALRPALALQWIRTFEDVPPMDVKSLCDRLIANHDLYKEITQLIMLKATTKESDKVIHYPLIDSYIEFILRSQPQGPKEIKNNENIIEADNLFRKIIGSSSGK